MSKQYYCLVASLGELTLEAEHKGFDALALRDEISLELSQRDHRALALLYSFYDVENVINLLHGKEAHNPLGNYPPEELAQAVADSGMSEGDADLELPPWMRPLVAEYRQRQEARSGEESEGAVPIENALWNAFYRQTAVSTCRFVREWFSFDQTLRNVSAAYIARGNKWPVGEQLVGENDVTRALAQNSGADFGLRNEVDYIESILALLEMKNMLEKERRLDQIRWAWAEDLTAGDYFDINYLLGYLARVNIIHRWTLLDRQQGEAMLRQLLDELSDKSILERAEQQ